MGGDSFGINRQTIMQIVEQVKAVVTLGVEVGIVVGGGNIFRGVAPAAEGMDRATADYMGMLATVMNALALGDAMIKAGLTARVMSAIAIDQVVEPYVRPKALQYLEEGKVVIFAAATGAAMGCVASTGADFGCMPAHAASNAQAMSANAVRNGWTTIIFRTRATLLECMQNLVLLDITGRYTKLIRSLQTRRVPRNAGQIRHTGPFM